MNQTQKGVLVAIVVFLLGGGAYLALKPHDGRHPEAMKDAIGKVADAGKAAGNMLDLGAAVDKTGRLIADAGVATNAMRDLYKDGKVPEAPALAEARGKIEAALNGVMAVDLPADATGAPADMLKRARDTAAKALDILKTLPTDPAGAVAALTDLTALLTGAPATPPAETTAPAAATAPTAPAEADATAKQETPAADAAAGADATAAATTEPAAAPSAEAAGNAPAFDLLRVEPDGSTVIAGRARDGDKIEILDGDTVVSSTEANVGGDFAAVFETPLSPGDHQLTIRATGKDGKTVTSSEVATVSVPKDQSGQLLAMVSKPGEASRVITAPASTPAPAADAGTQQAATETAVPVSAATTEPAAATPAPAAAKAALQISAVEVEGDRIFVAGTADPGSKVSAYADDKLIAADETSADGHFVIEGMMPLSVGEHRIRVDQLGADGKVAFRAEVPFDRPEGAQVAAVATPAGTDAGQASAMHLLGDGAFDAARAEALKAFDLLQGLFAGGKVPSAEQYAAARSATQIALQSLIDFVLPADADATSRDLVAKTRDSAQKALSLVKALPADPAGVGTALAAIETLIREAVSPESGGAAPAAAAPASAAAEPASAPAATAAAEPPAPAAEAPIADQTNDGDAGPTQVAQAPLKGSTNTVIIRKGDTLWQISRRVYGLGVRYTTIYLANRQQIADPDRILPGQVFGVPEKALPNAEELHRQRMHGEKIL